MARDTRLPSLFRSHSAAAQLRLTDFLQCEAAEVEE